MNFRQALKMALQSIKDSKIRSALTMLGVIIGVSAVITLVSVVDAATDSILATFDDVGVNMITLMLTGRAADGEVELKDFEELIKEYPQYFEGVAPIMMSKVTGKYKTNTGTFNLMGTNEAFFKKVGMLKLQHGRTINDVDVDKRTDVCVVGTYIQKEIFKQENPVGKTIRVNGRNFEVVGLLQEVQGSSPNGDDNFIISPYTTAQRFLKTSKTISYYISIPSTEVAEDSKAILENYLNKKLTDDDSYAIVDMSSIIDTINDITGMLGMLLGGIAAISLVVGGIGIMNIMLVTVTERTREIGIRKAIGAKRRSILIQFLIEAILISGIGGIIGIVIGSSVTYLIGQLMGLTALPSIGVVILSFGFSVAIGVFFGLYPADKASKLNPIDALRYQ